jgi:hypothetical protein
MAPAEMAAMDTGEAMGRQRESTRGAATIRRPIRKGLLVGVSMFASLAVIGASLAGCGSASSTASTASTSSAPPPAPNAAAAKPAQSRGHTSLTGPRKPPRNKNKLGFGPPRIDMTVSTGDASLTLLNHSESQDTGNCGGADTQPPSKIQPQSNADYCFQVTSILHADAETDFTYAIDGSPDVLWGHSKVPFTRPNTLDCQIRNKDTNQQDQKSRYTCSVEWRADGGAGENPRPHISVAQKPAVEVTDVDQARKILDNNCGAGQTQCTYKASKQQIIAAPQSQWRAYGTAQTNCDSKVEPDEHEVGQKQTISWSDTFGITGGAKFNIAIVKADVQVSYEHHIEESHEFSERHTQKVPYGKTVAFFLQPGVLDITGDFLVYTPTAVYSIKNFTFDIPLNGTYQPPGGGPPIQQTNVLGMSWDHDCSPGAKAGAHVHAGDPPPANAVVTPIDH